MFRLPNALPEELLLSRLIRFVTISGVSGSQFLKACFGSRKKSVHPFLTSGLNSIAEIFNEDAVKLLRNETLAPLFSFFMPEHAAYLQQMMLTNNAAKAIRASQLPSFESGSTLALKYCPVCVCNDLYDYGVSYWHRDHQVPGLTVCSRHGALLLYQDLDCRQRVTPGLLPSPSQTYEKVTKAEQAVAKFTNNLLELLTAQTPENYASDTYKARLCELGYLTVSGRVRRKALMSEFWLFISTFRQHPFTPLPIGPKDYRYVSQLLERRTNHHPFRHLV